MDPDVEKHLMRGLMLNHEPIERLDELIAHPTKGGSLACLLPLSGGHGLAFALLCPGVLDSLAQSLNLLGHRPYLGAGQRIAEDG